MKNTVKLLAAVLAAFLVLLFGFKNVSFAQTNALTAGTFEDNNPAFTYTGRWFVSNSAEYTSASLRYTNDPAAFMSFSFSGTRLTLIRTLAYNRGAMQVCIDGACQTVQNYSATTMWQQSVSFNVASGTHTVEIRNTSTSYIDLDTFVVEGSTAAAPTQAPTQNTTNAFGEGLFEDNHANLTYTGGWLAYNGAEYTSASLRYTNDPAARMSFSFSGTRLTLIRTLAYNRGPMQVCIDGACQTVQNYSAITMWQQPVSFNVASGTHTVEIRNASTAYIDFDTFRVENVAAPAPTQRPTAAPTQAPTQQPTAAPVVTLAAPNIVAPSNSLQVASEAQPLVFNWDTVSGATGYNIQISTSAAFTSFVYDVKPSSDGWAAQTPFGAGTYYWRVRAMNGTTAGAWTPTLSYIITAAAPTPVAPHLHPMATQVPYGANSVWNTPIAAGAAYDRYSSQMIAQMGKGTTGGKVYSDTAQYSYPVYWADKNTPRYNVPCAQYKCTVVDAAGKVTRVTMLNNVPIPDGAKQSDGRDAQLIVIDTETGIEYGFYHMVKQADGSWKADNGYMYNINYPGTQPGFGSRGAGVPYYAGMIRPHEIRDGEIRHAIAFVYQFTQATKCVFPAAQTDGTTTSGYPIPEGARIQLNPNLTDADFDRMGLSRAGKIVARALQKYGMILIDTGGSPKIIAENLTANTLYGESWSDPDLGYTKDVIAGIPYTEFRVLAMPDGYHSNATPNYGKCNK